MLPSDPKNLSPRRDETAASPQSQHDTSAPPELPAALSSAPSIGAIMHSLRRCWKVVVPMAFLAATVAGGIAWMLVPAQYTSTLVMRLLTRPTLGNLDSDENFANVQKAQVAILTSYPVVSEAIVKSHVTETYGITESPQRLAKKLVTHFNDGPEMLAVQLSGENPEAVAALLNALGDVLPNKLLKQDEDRINSIIAQKDKQLLNLASLLRDKRIDLELAEKSAGLDKVIRRAKSLDGAEKMRNETMRDVRVADKEVTVLENDRDAKKRRINGDVDPIVPEIDIQSALSLDSGYGELMRDIDTQKKKIGDIIRLAAPATRAAALKGPQADLAQMERSRDRKVDRVRSRLAQSLKSRAREMDRQDLAEIEIRLLSAVKHREKLNEELRDWEKELDRFKTDGPKAPPEVMALRDQVELLEKEQARLGEQKAGLKGLFPISPRLSRHTDAFVPTEKEYSRPLKYSLAAGALVFGVFLVGGALLEARLRRISGSEEVREGLGLKVIGTLPAMPAAARRKSAAALSMGGMDSQFGLTEAVDAVRTRLLHAPRVDGARIVMITSAIGGEGKTTLASHLAASLARAWRKTLLIDGDLRKPNAHLQFDLPNEQGLCEALRGEVEFEDAIKPTLISRLWMLPAGQIDGHALQAMTQEGVSVIFERLKEQYDFIIIDTSPVIPVPDALVIGQQADVVILTVMKDVSRMPAVYQAQQSLEDLGIRVLGAVVIGEKTETYGKAVAYGPVTGT